MSLIAGANFVDLFIGEKFCDVKGLDGAKTPRVPAPLEWETEISELRARCKTRAEQHGEPEFSITLGDLVLRITKMTDLNLEDIFFVRRSSANIRKVDDLGLPSSVLKTWRQSELRGLVLIAGEMANGKTSTAAGFVVDRLENHGGLCIAIEDPPETNLSGEHGLGRCVQVQASRRSGGYAEHLYHAMRTGADLIFIGEIRDQATACEALNASINGHLILATIHGGDPAMAVERIITLASGGIENAAEVLATGLSMVIWQSLNRTHMGDRVITRMTCQPLILTGPDGRGIKEKIRQGKPQQILQDVIQQQNTATWSDDDA
ncbi:ATPase, T2SS/T4P/T4SS family [Pseudomonas sp. AB12(2023)]|uniref:ATPase, T2SS/T4P/T4SS family n=1 Tax=Pseudomonas sp. AB12(2023) TaxID=3048597 RepID=UPI002B23872A|nr:ATPase, T2SS/T4P/T4SS family [Pseudomonas sp. AB12(2023)]MEB0222041.1 ATPase, T2SS/T4P/T4SS family [Pseudomonas sp. AB12(2023)]